MRDFGPNTSGVDGGRAVINDVLPPLVIEPISVKPDEVVIIQRPGTSPTPPPEEVHIIVKKVTGPVVAPKISGMTVSYEG